jgi:hypothetical protein
MSAVDRQVIAKVKLIEGEVIAVSPDGSKRVLVAGDFIFSDEMIDTSKGKIVLAQDGDIVLQNDIAAILGQDELTAEEKANIDKILKDLEDDDKDLLAKILKDKMAPTAAGEAGQDMHEGPLVIKHNPGDDPGVNSRAQAFFSFGPYIENPKTFFVDETPEQFVPAEQVITPFELRATTFNQLANPSSPNSVSDYYGVLAQNNNVIKQDLSSAFDVLIKSHPDAVFGVSVSGNIANYTGAQALEFPAPIILPFGLGMQPWQVIAGDAPNTVTYLYRKQDLNLLSAMDNKQILLDSADEQINNINLFKQNIENQIAGISDLSLDKFEIQSNLNQVFIIADNLKNLLVAEIVILNNQKTVAEANLATWEGASQNFGIPINATISNAAAIAQLEASWKILGGAPDTIPSLLESLYGERAAFEQVINQLESEIYAKGTLQQSIVSDIIGPLLQLTNYIPVDDADLKQELIKASNELSKQLILAEGYKNSLQASLNDTDLVLRTGLANDADFGFKSQVVLVDSISAINPVIVGDLFDQGGGLVNVDALASGLKVELNGHLSNDQILTLSSDFDAVTTKLILDLDLKFANPSADENIHIEIPGFPGLDWTVNAGLPWVVNPDNSLTLDLPSSSPVFNSRSGILDQIELSFPTAILKNIELNNFNFKILINSQVVPINDNEADLNNNTLNQVFDFNILGDLPGRGIYLVENEGQLDALGNVEKHAIVDIKPLLENISNYIALLSGPALTNFLNNTKIEFKFFNVDAQEPPKVLLSSGIPDPSIDFVKIGDSWVLTGQTLKNYVDAWDAAVGPVAKAYFEQPYIIAAPYGAEDMSIKVFGLINGANEVVIQPIVPLIIDAVAQAITAEDVDLSGPNLNVDFTKFDLKVNIVAPDGDGSEARLVDINLTNVLQYTSDVPLNFDPQWTVFSNNGIWSIDTVSVPGEIHLIGNLVGVSGTTSSTLTLGFLTAALEYLPPIDPINNKFYEIKIGSDTFNTPDITPPGVDNLAGVTSIEIVDSNEKDFDRSVLSDEEGPIYLKAGDTIFVPASIVIRREAQVDVADLTPGYDAYSIDISKALVDLYSSLDAAGKIILDSGVIPLPGVNVSIDNLLTNTKILFLENSIENAQFTLSGPDLFNKMFAYNPSAPSDPELGKILYYIGQYEAEENTVQVLLTDAMNIPIAYPDLPLGVILPEKTVVFDAVGSGTDIPTLALNGVSGVTLGFPQSTLNLDFAVLGKDIDTEKVEITITLPNEPDPSFLKAFATPGVVFGWELDPASAPEWVLNGNTLTGVFDLQTIASINIASTLGLKFNTAVLTNLDANIPGSSIFSFGYAIHSIDSDSPDTYIIPDNQSVDLTGVFGVDVGALAGIYLIKELDNKNFDAADAILPTNNQALLVPISQVIAAMHEKILSGEYDTDAELTQFFAASNIRIEITAASLALPITEDNLPRVGLNDPNGIILTPNATGEDRLLDNNNVDLGITIIRGNLLQEFYNAWVASSPDVALRTVPDLAIFGGPFYDNDFKLEVTTTIADILNAGNNITEDVFQESTVVVDATAHGVAVVNNVPQFFISTDLDWVIDASGYLTGYVDVKFNFDAKFLDLTGLEYHQAVLDFSFIPDVNQSTMVIVDQTGADVSWAKPSGGTGIFVSDAMFSSEANQDMVGSVTIRFNGATLPPAFFENYSLGNNINTVDLQPIFNIISTIDPVDQEFILSDNQVTSTYSAPLIMISSGVDEQGALDPVIPQIPVDYVSTPVWLDTAVSFEAIFNKLAELYVINGIITNSANIKASSVVIETSGIPLDQKIPDLYFDGVLQNKFSLNLADIGNGYVFSQGGSSTGVKYTLTGDALYDVFNKWLSSSGDDFVTVKSGLYNSYPFSVSSDGIVKVQVDNATIIDLPVVGQLDTLVRVDASAEGFMNEDGITPDIITLATNVNFEKDLDTNLLTGNAIVEVQLVGKLTDIDGSEKYQIEIQMTNATGSEFTIYTGGPANELQWKALGGGKFVADIDLSAASNEPGYVAPGFFANFSTTGVFDTSVKLLINNQDLDGLSDNLIKIVTVLRSEDEQPVATGSTLTANLTEIFSPLPGADNNHYETSMPEFTASNQVGEKVNELIWEKDIVKLAFQEADFGHLLPIPVFKDFIETFKTAVDTAEIFLNSDSLVGRNFSFKVDVLGDFFSLGDSKAYIAMYNNGVQTIVEIDLDVSFSVDTTTYTGIIPGQFLKDLYDAYMDQGTFTPDDINYLTNIFVALPTQIVLENLITSSDFEATLTHTVIPGDPTKVPAMNIQFDPTDLIGSVSNPNFIDPDPTLASTAIDNQAISINIYAALQYLYEQLVSGSGALDATRLSNSKIEVTLEGVDVANSLVYLVDPDGANPVPDVTQVSPSPILNNAFLAGSGDNNVWTITGDDLVQLFTQRYGATPNELLPNPLPNVSIVAKLFSGEDVSVKMDVVLNNPSAPNTTENIIPETLYIIDDTSHGAIVNRIYDEGLSLKSTITYITDLSTQDDKFAGPDTTGGITGEVQIKFNVDASILDVNSGEQHYLVIEMFTNPIVGNLPANLPPVQIFSSFGLTWVEHETDAGSIFIAQVPAGQNHVISDITIKMSLADLVAKGYLLPEDSGNLDKYYETINELAVNFNTALKLYSTLDVGYIINGYNTLSANQVEGVDGIGGNNSLINSTATQPLQIRYSSVPVGTTNDANLISTGNTFNFSILPIMMAIQDRIDLLGLINNDDIISASNIKVTITGLNGVVPTLLGNADLPDSAAGTKLSDLLDNGPNYTLDTDNMLIFYNLWKNADASEKSLLENWFFPPEVGNNRDFTVQVEYRVGGYQTILPVDTILLEDHLVVVRAVVDSDIDAILLQGTQPIIHRGVVPALPGEDAPADGAFDFNAANAARFITQLHVKIDFMEENPGVTRLVEIFMPKAGPNVLPDATAIENLEWKLVPGAENGWVIDSSYSATQVRMYKLFEPAPNPGDEIAPTETGNIDEYLALSFLVTGVGGYNLRSLTPTGPGPIIADQYFGLTYRITTSDDVDMIKDLGDDNLLADATDVLTGSVTQDIVVPSFVNVFGPVPAVFTNQDDYYFISDPGEGLTASRTIIGLPPIVSGSVNDPDGHYDFFYNAYVDVENGSPGLGFNTLLLFIESPFGGVMTNPFPLFAATDLQDQHPGNSAFLLPGDPVVDPIYNYIRFSWDNSLDPIHTFEYEYQLRGGAAPTPVTEYGVGRFFEPGEGDDIVVGSYGRDIFKSSTNDFVAGVNTILVDGLDEPVDLGNDVFIGGLGRDWIEGGAGNDIAYSDGMGATPYTYTGDFEAYAPVFLSSSIGSASLYLPKITDVIATGAGNDIIYTGGLNYAGLTGAGGPDITGHNVKGIDDAENDKSAGVLVFAGSGDNVVFSGKGADIIVLDDTIGITRIVPTDSGWVVPEQFNLQNGLHYVYNSDVAGGNFASLFTDGTDAGLFKTAQTLNSAGQLSIVDEYDLGDGNGIQNSYLYDVIRPIYESTTDTDLNYADALSGATDSDFRTAEHGANTLVYWKDSVTSDSNNADVVMYFDVNSDKINLAALFNELNPDMTDVQRLAAIQLTEITSVTPTDSTSNSYGGDGVTPGLDYDPFSQDGRDGTRVSVTINGNNYVVADLANVEIGTIVKDTVFEVMAAPEVPLS